MPSPFWKKPVVVTKTIVQVGKVTGTSLAQVDAAIDAASQNNEDRNLGARNKRIIIGVVAGIGSFIIMAAVGFILVRMWCKSHPRKESYQATDISDFTSFDEKREKREKRRISGLAANF